MRGNRREERKETLWEREKMTGKGREEGKHWVKKGEDEGKQKRREEKKETL